MKVSECKKIPYVGEFRTLLQKNVFRTLKYSFVSLAFFLYCGQGIIPEKMLSNLSLLVPRGEDLIKSSEFNDTYSYLNVHRPFNSEIPLVRVSELNKDVFEDLILEATPLRLKKRLMWFLKDGLVSAEKYQVDPFWVLAIMWTESHFIPSVMSSVGAIGPMQIMPKTGKYLAKALSRQKNLRDYSRFNTDPFINIEMGVYYLNRLLRRFNSNYIQATVAYNMGPSWVSRRIWRNLGVGVKNVYLDKVRKAYKRLSYYYIRKMRLSVPFYKKTYVYRYRPYRRANILAEFSFESLRSRKKSFRFVSL